jgi:hypothetical protein
MTRARRKMTMMIRLVNAIEMALGKLYDHPTYTQQEIDEDPECAIYMMKEREAIGALERFISTMQRSK